MLDDVFANEVEQLDILAHNKINELDRTVALRRHGEISAALAEVNLGYGKTVMEQARIIAARAVDRIRTARNMSKVDSKSRNSRAVVLLTAMGITTAFLMLYGWLTMYNAARRNDQLADRLSREAMLDPLTGLPNRRYFETWATQSLRQANRLSCPFAVILLDLDGFKRVNDTLGHLTGDEVLCEAAKRLRATLRAGEFLARLGGDEFAAIITGDTSRAGIARLGERLIDAMKPKCHPSLNELSVGVSLGVAISTTGQAPLFDLLENADGALYESKRAGRGVVSFVADVL